MQTQLIFVFIAQALLITGAHAQESLDASCDRYAARIGIYASCDRRDFFEPSAPVSDIGQEAALAQRLSPAAPNQPDATPTVPRPEDPHAVASGVG